MFINDLSYCFDKYMKPNFEIGDAWHHYILIYPDSGGKAEIFIRVPGWTVGGIDIEKVDEKLIIKKISINECYQSHYIDNFENIVNDMFIGKPVSLDKKESEDDWEGSHVYCKQFIEDNESCKLCMMKSIDTNALKSDCEIRANAEKLSRKEKRKQIHQLLAFAGIVSGLSGYSEESTYEKEDHSQK